MQPVFRIIAVQATPVTAGTPISFFADHVAKILDRHPEAGMVIFPELHLFSSAETGRDALLRNAEALESEFTAALGEIALRHQIWLVPGSINERGAAGDLYNTALVFGPDGTLRASYRKMFPWRPYEPHTPGLEFVVFDIDGVGRMGISTCYDMWFPETSRNLTWLGADLIINLVRTTTPDRAQEIILARANAIFNQVYFASVNCAGPEGFGASVIVGPEGEVIAEAMHTDEAELVWDFSAQRVEEVRSLGTAGTNRMWEQFRPGDHTVTLPIYNGLIDPARWTPVRRFTKKEEKS